MKNQCLITGVCWALSSRSKQQSIFSLDKKKKKNEVMPGPPVIFLRTHSRD